MSNPYRSPSVKTESHEPRKDKPLGRLGSLWIAAVIGCGVTVIVGEALSIVVLIPPIRRWFGMEGVFSGLIVIGMPMWAGGCGLVTATILGAMFPRKHAASVAIAVGVLLVVGCSWGVYEGSSHPSDQHFVLTSAMILLVATMSGILAADKGLTKINRIRTEPSPDEATRRKTTKRLRSVLVGLTIVWGFLDAAALAMIFEYPNSFWLFLLSLGGLMFGLGLIALCMYQSAARSELRTVSLLCFAMTTASLFATLYLWLRIVWLN